MFRSASTQLGRQLKRFGQRKGGLGLCRNFNERGQGRNLPMRFGFGRGPGWGLGFGGPRWGGPFDGIASRMMDRHMRQMERMMDEVMGSSGPKPWWCRWGDVEGLGRGEVEAVKCNEKEFEVKVNVSEFKPEDLEVKVTEDRLTLSGKHEHEPDQYGYVSREFTRHFQIPENVDIESMETLLTEDGILVVRANVKANPKEEPRKLDIKVEPKKSDK